MSDLKKCPFCGNEPTIRIFSGTEVNLITNVTIDLPPLEPYEVEEKYVRY